MIKVCQLLESGWWLRSDHSNLKKICSQSLPKKYLYLKDEKKKNLTLHFTTRTLVKYENELIISHRGKHTPNPGKWSVPYLLVTRHIPPMQLTTTIMIYDWNIVGSGACLTSLALIQNISIINEIFENHIRGTCCTRKMSIVAKYTSVYDVPRHCHTLCDKKKLAVFAN